MILTVVGVDGYVICTSVLFASRAVGHMATHAIVVAQLIIGEQNHGVHPFIVQIRSLDDHKPCPGEICHLRCTPVNFVQGFHKTDPYIGVEVGDIGPKFGYSESDHGYLRLTNVRIPRDQMLMKYSHVSPALMLIYK